MEKNEAVSVMQDILMHFTGSWFDFFVLRESNGKDEALGYKVCLRGKIDKPSLQKIREIAAMYNFRVKEENGLVIYEPAITV